MNPIRSLTVSLAASAVLVAGGAWAHDFKAGTLAIGHPWARPTAPGQPVGGGYLTIDNKGSSADRLVDATSPVADHLELHMMAMEGDVMRMRRVDAVEVPAGGSVKLEPGGYHLMFVGLKNPFKSGDKVPLKLRFEKAGEVTVEVWIEQPKAGDAPAAHAHP